MHKIPKKWDFWGMTMAQKDITIEISLLKLKELR
jgi:hypothetical protein